MAFKDDFKSEWWFFLLPDFIKQLYIFRWLNKNAFPIDIQNWGDGKDGRYDYGISHPYRDEVYTDNVNSLTRTRNFDEILIRANKRAIKLYNEIYKKPLS